MQRRDVRNIALIAHVDHGKTTLVDGLLRQGGAFRSGEAVQECAMDSNDLERERGITILSKCTAITWEGTRINIVDTPGHADFGGEVERVLRMVDSVLLLVDAFEGPMPQTRFVTRKALALGLRPIVVINKIDRVGCDPDAAVDQVFDLFDALGADDAQLDFPVVFASGREGYAVHDLESEPREDLRPLLDLIVERVPGPEVDASGPLVMQVATLSYDDYLGYVAVGRIESGEIATADRVLINHRGGAAEEFRVMKLLAYQGLRRFETTSSSAGDIVAVTGMEDLSVGETICSLDDPVSLPMLAIDEPTISVQFQVNDGPFAGKEGRWVTSRNLRERLYKEVKSNIALRVEDTDRPYVFDVAGRGELHLTVLIETMRREGYELCVSQPKVIFREDEQGNRLEPYEELHIDVEEAYSGAVIEELGRRTGQLVHMEPDGAGRVKIEYRMPSRGLIGYRSRFMTDTRGTGVMNHNFFEYGPYAGPLRGRRNGVLVVKDIGESNAYTLNNLQDRGILFLGHGEAVYGGQILGQNSREYDIIVNPSIPKKLTNIRSAGADEKIFLTPPRRMSLEAALEFINDDELVEVTPKSIRLRKRVLDHNDRKRSEKLQQAEDG